VDAQGDDDYQAIYVAAEKSDRTQSIVPSSVRRMSILELPSSWVNRGFQRHTSTTLLPGEYYPDTLVAPLMTVFTSDGIEGTA